MAAGLSFKQTDKTTDATGPSDIGSVILEDNTGNKYILGTDSGQLQLVYEPQTGTKATYNVDGLAKALGSLLSTEDAGNKSVLVTKLGELLASNATPAQYDGATDQKPVEYLAAQGKLVTEGNLKTEVVKADVVKAIVGSSDFTGAVYTKQAANAGFATKTDLAAKVDLDATNLDNAKVSAMLEKLQDKVVQVSDLPTEVEKPAVAAKILGAKDGAKFVLVDELGKALSGAAADYNKDGNNVTPADFLGPKGMQGPTGLTGPAGLRGQAGAGSGAINATDPDFTAAVREVVSSDYISDNPAYWDF